MVSTMSKIIPPLILLMVFLTNSCYSKSASEDVDDVASIFNRVLANHLFGVTDVHELKRSTKNDNSPRVDLTDTIDDLFAQIRKNVLENGREPIVFPSSVDTFTTKLYERVLDGSFTFSNARLGGFSTIHRTGDCTLDITPIPPTKPKGDVVINVGGNDIVIGFDVSLGVGIFRKNLQFELLVSHVDLMIGIQAVVSPLPTPSLVSIALTDFILKEIGEVKITIDGIPGGGGTTISDRLTLISNLAKDSLTYAFQEAFRAVIEGLLNSLFPK